MTMAPWRWAIAATSARSGDSVKPSIAKLDGWTRRTAVARPSASGASKSAARVRFVVPTSTRRAPARAHDLRDPDAAADLHQLAAGDHHAAPRRPARPTASSRAAALLVTTSASSAPVSATRCSSAAGTGARAGRCRVELQVTAGAAAAAARHGAARPGRAAEVRVQDHAGRVDDACGRGDPLEGIDQRDHRVGELGLAAGVARVGRAARAPRPRRRAPGP